MSSPESQLRAVCVYCASATGSDPALGAAAAELGRTLAEAGLRLVYGGGAVGLMGIVADATIAAGGDVVGVIPKGLFSREVAHTGLTELHEVESMHQRKQLMFELADAFVALPGGFGTLEELAEVVTWAQLGLHAKPIVLVDLEGFWQPLIAQFDRMVERGVLKPSNRSLVVSVASVAAVFDALANYSHPREPKWIDLDET